MRKLSFNTTTNTAFRVNAKITSLVYADKGSFVEFEDDSFSLGSCIACKTKSCISYNTPEMNTPSFLAFPHNTSNRVCPIDAISVLPEYGFAAIDYDTCIGCGLCIHRCPVAAIQFDMNEGKCSINIDEGILVKCSTSEQDSFLQEINDIDIRIDYTKIPVEASDSYLSKIHSTAKGRSDVADIILRNYFINQGIPCNINAKGNNHMRTKFFAEDGELVLFGESNDENGDTLSLPRRIMDDYAVLTARHGFSPDNIVSLAIINGLPNKRTDYYEVINDVKNILGFQIHTITYHILFILNLFNKKLSIRDFTRFVANKDSQDLLPGMKELISNIEERDGSTKTFHYSPEK